MAASTRYDLSIDKIDETFMKIYTSDGIARELNEHFTFEIPNAMHVARQRGINPRHWDGKKKMFHLKDRKLYIGLLNKVLAFAKRNGYTYEVNFEALDEDFDPMLIEKFIDKMNLPYDAYDFQVEAVQFALERRRALVVSPTSSGKSLIMYMLSQLTEGACLITVPTVTLVTQLEKEFIGYGCDPRSIQTIHAKSEFTREVERPIVISTWHSVYEQPEEWFDVFNLFMGDEAHGYKATSLVKMMESARNVPYKIGLTGTLDEVEVNEMVLEGLFGQKFITTTLREMIDNGICSDIEIVCVVINYPEDVCKRASKMDYQDEKRFLTNNEARNNFIVSLGMETEGNVLTLFEKIDEHGHKLYEMALERTEKVAHYIHGKIDVEVRDQIKDALESEGNQNLYASYGTFSTGENVKRLNRIIMGSPAKSRIRILQSLGRGARKHGLKDKLVFYDIADNLSYKGKDNKTLDHFKHRIEIYNKEDLDYRIVNVEL